MTPADWTLGKLFDTLRAIKSRAESADRAIADNNVRGVQLYEAAQRIPDPAERARVRTALEQWGARQVAIVRRHQVFAQQFRDATAQVKAWLARINVPMPTDLGIGPAVVLVPVVVAGAVIVALQYVRSVEIANQTQRQGLTQSSEILAMLRAGQIDGATAAAMIDRTVRQSNQQAPDLFGLEQLGEILVPLIVVAGAVMLLPQLTRARK